MRAVASGGVVRVPPFVVFLCVLAGSIGLDHAYAKSGEDNWSVCGNQSGDHAFQAIVEACRALIESGGEARTISEAHNMLGIAYGDHGDFVRAAAEFTAAIRLIPDDESAPYTNRGVAHRNLGNFDAAIADYDAALRINPRSSRALNNRCWARAVTGSDLELALDDCTASLAIDADPNTNGTRCLVHLRLADYRSALDDCEIAYAGDPDSARALYGRGLANKGLGRHADAYRDMSAALERDPSVATEHVRYGIEVPDQ